VELFYRFTKLPNREENFMKHIFTFITVLILVLVPVFGLQPSLAAPATTITVTTTVDEFGTGADCSLREAIQSANTDTAFGGCTAGSGADTITLPAGTYTLTGAAGEYNNASGDLNINSSLTINGAESRTTFIQAGTTSSNGVDRVFYVSGNQNTVVINDVTIRYGKAQDGIAGASDSTCNGKDGGGIYNSWDTTLILNNSTVSYNRAGDSGDDCASAAISHGGYGGGIYAGGQVELNNTVVRRNESGAGGDGPTGVKGAYGGFGGGIYIRINSVVTLTNSAVAYNFTGIGGRGGDGDPSGGNAGNGGGGGDGAGIYNSNATLTLISSFVNENENGSGGDGGDASNGDGGNGAPGGTAGGIYNYSGEMTFAVDSSIKNNVTGFGGLGGTGSISNGTDSYRGTGGGLYSNNGSIVTLIDTTVSGNVGRGITNANTQMTLDGCTISNNQSESHAGGIYNNASILMVSNSTISENTAWIDGGGIYNTPNSTASLTHVTITNNTADYDNSGTGNSGGFFNTGVFTITNSIVAENVDTGGLYPDCFGTFISGDYNLLGELGSDCTFTAQANDLVGSGSPIDPNLGPLANNGGNTNTHALLSGSPAIDAIQPASCLLDHDQRGLSRPVDYDGDGIGQCDIGAVEIREYYNLEVDLAGEGQGSVLSSPMGIDCDQGGGDCTEIFDINTVVTLTASAAAGSTLAGWGGDCSGSDSNCVVTMDMAHSVTATFDLIPTHTLSANLAGDGAGSVISDPSGIDCGEEVTDCSAVFYEGDPVTLTASAITGSTFAGWSGSCSGTAPTCVVTMDMTRSVTATFDMAPTYTLSISLLGEGTGNIGSNPAGIDCGDGGTDCIAVFYEGTVITLTATATTGSNFAGWGGDASGTNNPLIIKMDGNKPIEANFVENAMGWLIYLPIVIR